MAHEATPTKPEDLSLRVLVPALMISELKRALGAYAASRCSGPRRTVHGGRVALRSNCQKNALGQTLNIFRQKRNAISGNR